MEETHSAEFGPSQKVTVAQGMGLSVFIGMGWLMNEKSIPSILGKRMEISMNWATAHFLTFMVSLGTVMVPVGVSLSLPICYNECILRLKV